MSNEHPPLDLSSGFIQDNFLDTTDNEFSLDELETIFAKKYNMNVSGISQIKGDVNIHDNKNIYINNNPLHTFNKTKRFIYTIHNHQLAIPFSISNNSSTNISQIYLCSLTRNDGIFSQIQVNPIFSFYLLCSPYSVMNPIPIIQNQVKSYTYDTINQRILIEFDRPYEIEVIFTMTQIQ